MKRMGDWEFGRSSGVRVGPLLNSRGSEEAGRGSEEAGRGLERVGRGLERAGRGLERVGRGLERARCVRRRSFRGTKCAPFR